MDKIQNNFIKVTDRLREIEEYSDVTQMTSLAWNYIGLQEYGGDLIDTFILQRTFLLKRESGYEIIRYECLTDKDWEPLLVGEKIEPLFKTKREFWKKCMDTSKNSSTTKVRTPIIFNGTPIYSFPRFGLNQYVAFIGDEKIETYDLYNGKTRTFDFNGKMAEELGEFPVYSSEGRNYLTYKGNDVYLTTVVNKKENNISDVISTKICSIPEENEVASIVVADNHSSFEQMFHLFSIVTYKDGKKALMITTEDMSKTVISEPLDDVFTSLDFVLLSDRQDDVDGFRYGLTFTFEKNGVKGEIKILTDLSMVIEPNVIEFTTIAKPFERRRKDPNEGR